MSSSANLPYEAPELISPEEKSTVDGRAVTFEWNDAPGATGYRFQVAFDQEFNDLAVDTEVGRSTAFTVYDILPIDGAHMFWRVASCLPDQELFTEARSIEIAVEHVPAPENQETSAIEQDPSVPHLVSPATGEVTDGLATTFEWIEVDHATSYRFQLAEDSSFSSFLMDTDVGNASILTIYDSLPLDGPELTWRIGAVSGEMATWSKPATFVAVSDLTERLPGVTALAYQQALAAAEHAVELEEPEIPRDPTVPFLTMPAHGDVTDGLATTFEWELAERAQAYRFQIAGDSGFEEVLVDTKVGNTNILTVYDSLPLDGPELMWRVAAVEGADTRWSEPSVFSSVSDFAERVKETARAVMQTALADLGAMDEQALAAALPAPAPGGAMRLAMTWVVVTTALALLIILKVLLT